MKKAQCHNGQSLTDYALVVGLVSIVGLGTLSLLGQSIQEGMNNLMGMAGGQGPSPGGTPPVDDGGNIVAPPAQPLTNMTITLANGHSLTLTSSDLAAVAETAGGSGVTENALALIEQLINNLSNEDPPPPGLNELAILAQKGHAIKDVQKAFEAKFAAHGPFASEADRKAFMLDENNKILVGTEMVTLHEAAKMLGNNYTDLYTNPAQFNDYYRYVTQEGYVKESDGHIVRDADGNKVQVGSYLKDFMDQLTTVKNSGLLNDPVLKQLVEKHLSMQIFMSSNQTMNAPSNADVVELVNTTLTNSNGICSISNNVTCQQAS